MLVAARSSQWSKNCGHDHELEGRKHFSNAGLYKNQKGGLGKGSLSLPTVQGYRAKSYYLHPICPTCKEHMEWLFRSDQIMRALKSALHLKDKKDYRGKTSVKGQEYICYKDSQTRQH